MCAVHKDAELLLTDRFLLRDTGRSLLRAGIHAGLRKHGHVDKSYHIHHVGVHIWHHLYATDNRYSHSDSVLFQASARKSLPGQVLRMVPEFPCFGYNNECGGYYVTRDLHWMLNVRCVSISFRYSIFVGAVFLHKEKCYLG